MGGEFASNFAWNMVAGFLLYYYTDIALLPVAALGTLMLVSRVLDAVIDPLVGIAVDRTQTRWGRARPYLLFASVPFGLLCVATFAVPDLAPTAKVIYAYVTFTLLGVCYSLLYIPYGALQPMMVRDPALKVRIGSWRAMATSLASILVYTIVQPLVGLAGPDRWHGYVLAATVVASITVALYLLVFARCRERYVSVSQGPRRGIAADLKRLVTNPIWRFVLVLMLLIFVRIGVMVSVTAYFAINVLGRPAVASALLPMLSVALLVGGFIAGQLLKHVGRRTANAAFLIVSVILYLAMPRFENNTPWLVATFMLANMSIGVMAATIYVACTDAVEYQEQKFGEGSEGMVFASVSFGMKVGMAIGAAATAYALGWAHYDPKMMTTDASHMVRALFYSAPIGICIAQLLCFLLMGQEPAKPTIARQPTAGRRQGLPNVSS